MAVLKKFLILGALLAVPVLLAAGSQALTRSPGDPEVPAAPIIIPAAPAGSETGTPDASEGAAVTPVPTDPAAVDPAPIPAPAPTQAPAPTPAPQNPPVVTETVPLPSDDSDSDDDSDDDDGGTDDD